MDEMRGGKEETRRRSPRTSHKTTTRPTRQFAILLRALRHALALGVLLAIPSQSDAFFVDLNTIYFSDTFAVTGSTQASTRMLYDIAMGIDIDSKGRFTVGWNVTSFSASDSSGGTPTTFSTMDMGPRFSYFLSRDKAWSLNVAYLLIATGAYKPAGGTEEKLRGTTIKADLGYMPQIGDATHFGIKLNYYAPSFSESLDSAGTTITKVTYTRAFMFPSLGFSYRF